MEKKGSFIRVIEDEAHFRSEIQGAGTKLVVVDFTATWYVFSNLKF